jgi:glutamate/tyrosine decarboxylase-like PLP-dependent enzyme
MVAGTAYCRLIPTKPELEYALDPDDLAAAIEQDMAAGFIPFYLVGTIGTTSSAAVDPIAKLGAIARRHDMW